MIVQKREEETIEEAEFTIESETLLPIAQDTARDSVINIREYQEKPETHEDTSFKELVSVDFKAVSEVNDVAADEEESNTKGIL